MYSIGLCLKEWELFIQSIAILMKLESLMAFLHNISQCHLKYHVYVQLFQFKFLYFIM